MIRIECEPGSREWFEARLAMPTASNFHRIVTPKTLKHSAQSAKYINELLVEWATGDPAQSADNSWMERGREMELEAVRWYEMETNQETTVGGFCTNDEGTAGCSPDRLVGEDGGLEIKCPSAAVHVGYLLGMSDEYRMQAQGGLFITGRKWWDLVSYCPGWPPVLVRHKRDAETMEALEAQLMLFLTRFNLSKERLEELGVTPAARFQEAA